jgi:hypothetical protein
MLANVSIPGLAVFRVVRLVRVFRLFKVRLLSLHILSHILVLILARS